MLACAAGPSARAGLPNPTGWAEDGGPSASQISAAKASAALATRRLPELLAQAIGCIAGALPALAPALLNAADSQNQITSLETLQMGHQQIAAARVAAQALASLLQRQAPQMRLQTVLGLLRGSSSSSSLLAGAAAVLEHPQCDERCAQQIAALIGCLMADESCARALLGDGAVRQTAEGDTAAPGAPADAHPEPLCATGEPAGAALCAALARLVPSSFFIEEEEAGAGAAPVAGEKKVGSSRPGTSSGGDSTAAGAAAGHEDAPAASFGAPGEASTGQSSSVDDENARSDVAAVPRDQQAARQLNGGGEDEAAAGDAGRHSPGQTACLIALRNLVTYSRSAKVTAIGIGLHAALLDSAASLGAGLAAALAVIAAGSPAAGQALRPGSASRSRAGTISAARADTAAPVQGASPRTSTTAASIRPGTGAGAAAGGGGGAAARRVGSGTPLSLRRSGSGRRAAGVVQGKAGVLTGGDRGFADGLKGAPAAAAALDQERPWRTAATATAAAAAEKEKQQQKQQALQDAEARRRAQQQAAALVAARERRLLLCLGMLRHIAFRDAPAKEALVDSGLLRTVVKLWPSALQRPALLSELLTLLACLAPGSVAVRSAIAAAAGPRLPVPLSLMLQALMTGAAQAEGGGSDAVFKAAARALLHFGSSADGAATLAHPSCSFLPDAQKLLRNFLGKKADYSHAASILQLLGAVAAAPEGQRALLRATAAPALLDLTVSALQAPHGGAVSAALLLLHNLAFHADMRTPALANPRLLPLLLAAAESLQPDALLQQGQWQSSGKCCAGPEEACAVAPGQQPGSKPEFVLIGRGNGCKQGCSKPKGTAAAEAAAAAAEKVGECRLRVGGNVCAAAYAAAALWALMYQGESVKAAVRKLPGAGERLTTARAHCAFLLRGVCGDSDEAGNGGGAAAAAAAAAAEVAPACVGLEGSAAPTDLGWWLQQLEESLLAVGELLQQPQQQGLGTGPALIDTAL